MNDIASVSEGNYYQNISNEEFERVGQLITYVFWYLDEGFYPIPLDGKTLQPLVPNWKQYGSYETRADIEDFQRWHKQWPDMQLGAVTGREPLMVVVQVRNGGDVSRWPATTCSKTGDGGTNLFYWHPTSGSFVQYSDAVKVPNAKDILPLTDVIGEDGFVVLPFYDGKDEWIKEPDDFAFAHLTDDDIISLIIEDPNWELTNSPEMQKEVEEERQQFEQAEQQYKLMDAKATNAGKLRVWSIGDILKHDFGPEEWLVKSLITKQGITALSGNPGDYKTWITIHIALSVSRNAPVFGKFATTQGGVLIIDEEDHIRVVKGRLQLLGAKDTDAIHYLSQSGFKADNEKLLAAVVEFVKEKNIKLVILDSLVRIHEQEENDATGMAKVFSSIQKIIAAGASILFTHHHRKTQGFGGNSNPGQNMRGSSDILAAIDSHITVERKRDKEDFLLLKQTKSRQGEALKPFEISILKGSSGPSGFEYAGDYDERKAKAEEVAAVLPSVLADGMKSRPDIHEGLKDEFGKTAIDDGIKLAEEAGTIVRVPKEELPKENRRKAFYRLPGTAQSFLGSELPIPQSHIEIGKQEEDLPDCDYEFEEHTETDRDYENDLPDFPLHTGAGKQEDDST